MMNNEEAIAILKREFSECKDTISVYAKKRKKAFEMAIKALEQRGCVWEIAYKRGEVEVLNKIRAEIESQRKEISNKNSENDKLQAYYHGLNDGLKDARDILDKHKAESEESNESRNSN